MGSLNTCIQSPNDGLVSNRDLHASSDRPSVMIPILGCMCLLTLYITCGAAFVADTQNIDFR